MKKILSILLLFPYLLIAQIEKASIEKDLFLLPNLIFKEIPTATGYDASYELRIQQLLDHQDSSKGFFEQRVFLNHKGYERPTVIVTQGYANDRNGIYGPTKLLKANQINVEHRFFGESIPDSMDYRYLNLEQATADLHYIKTLFKDIYTKPWISTGISKGGQTTIMYRYFYPNDVRVSMPFVAPLNLSLEEERIYKFLDTVGTDACRKKIFELQRRILSEREAVLPLLRWYTYGAQLSFTELSFEKAFEYQVLEFPFSFWQWGGKCEEIPDSSASLEETLYYLIRISGINFYSDESMKKYASHYYQAGSEMGYYGYEIEPFKDLIQALPKDKNPSAIFSPVKDRIKYNNESKIKANKWLQKEGNRFIYINGNKDTWSATAVRPTEGIDALWFFIKDADHGKARIWNLDTEDKKLMIEKLEEWLEMEID